MCGEDEKKNFESLNQPVSEDDLFCPKFNLPKDHDVENEIKTVHREAFDEEKIKGVFAT